MDIDMYLWKHNMSAADLARKAGISPVMLHNYRRKKKFPRRDTAKKIEHATNGEITVIELCSGIYSTDLKNDFISKTRESTERIPEFTL